MKLYELPRSSFFKIVENKDESVYFFEHVDGMYSLCFDKENRMIHLQAFLEVEKVNNSCLSTIDKDLK